MVWLFAVGCVVWIGIFGYTEVLSRRQAAIDQRIEGMRTKLETDPGA